MDLLKPEMLGDVIINIINILILFFVTKALLYKPVKKYLAARREKEVAAMAAAETAKKEAEEAKTKYEALLSDAEAEKDRLLEQAGADAAAVVADARKTAEKQAEALREETLRAAEAEKAKLLEGAEREIGQTAVALSEKILGREVSDEDNRRLIDAFFKHLGD